MEPVRDRILVLDTSASSQPGEPPTFPSEMIELGYVLLRYDTEQHPALWVVARDDGRFVTPRRGLSQAAREATGLCEETLAREGHSYENTVRGLLREYPQLPQTPWMAWGSATRALFIREAYSLARSKASEVGDGAGILPAEAYPLSATFFDLQALFALQFHCAHDVTVERALLRFEKTFEGSSRSARNRALQIARVAVRMLNARVLPRA